MVHASGGALHSLGMLTLLLGCYLLWHLAASQVLGTSPVRSDLQQYLSVLAVLLFVSLYALQALIIAQPEGALARRLYPWLLPVSTWMNTLPA